MQIRSGESRSVTCVIPVLNEVSRLAVCLRAVFAAGPHEVIVVDGGSTDESCRVAREHGATVVSSEAGRGRQLQCGAEHATGDWLLFVHADCLIGAESTSQIEALSQDATIVGGAFRQSIDSDGWRYRLLELGNAWRAERLGWIYGDQAMFVRRDVFNQLGGFADMPLMEDLEFSKRLRKVGKTVVLPGPVVVSARRWQKQGIVFSTVRNWCFVVLYHLGVSPERLARWYRIVR